MSAKVFTPRIRKTWELGNYYHTKSGSDRYFNKSAQNVEEEQEQDALEVEVDVEEDYSISQLRNKFKSLNNPIPTKKNVTNIAVNNHQYNEIVKRSRYMMRKCNYDFAYERDCM